MYRLLRSPATAVAMRTVAAAASQARPNPAVPLAQSLLASDVADSSSHSSAGGAGGVAASPAPPAAAQVALATRHTRHVLHLAAAQPPKSTTSLSLTGGAAAAAAAAAAATTASTAVLLLGAASSPAQCSPAELHVLVSGPAPQLAATSAPAPVALGAHGLLADCHHDLLDSHRPVLVRLLRTREARAEHEASARQLAALSAIPGVLSYLCTAAATAPHAPALAPAPVRVLFEGVAGSLSELAGSGDGAESLRRLLAGEEAKRDLLRAVLACLAELGARGGPEALDRYGRRLAPPNVFLASDGAPRLGCFALSPADEAAFGLGDGSALGGPARLALLVHYVLSDGAHLFGNEAATRAANFAARRCEWSPRLAARLLDAADLIAELLALGDECGDGSDGNSAWPARISAHPFFMTALQRLDFLHAVASLVRSLRRLADSGDGAQAAAAQLSALTSSLASLGRKRFRVCAPGGEWKAHFDATLVAELCAHRSYDGTSLLDLVFFLRNLEEHAAELSDCALAAVAGAGASVARLRTSHGTRRRAVAAYMAARVPLLQVCLYRALASVGLRVD